METNDVLVSDIGCPSGEPKQSLAIGVNEALARNIAKEKTEKLRTSIITTERSCMKCHARFWATSHKAEEGLRATGKGYLCPECASNTPPVSVERYWCG
jgi:DNA-directed RNA polymerase subunit RPC12/RpoP